LGPVRTPPILARTNRETALKLAITPKYVELLTAAHAYTTQRQDTLRSVYGLAAMPHAHLNEATQQLVFSDASRTPRVLARVQLVGAVNLASRTWLWSWANPSVDPALCKDMLEVHMLGETRGIEQLTTPVWEGDAVDGWEMTSISTYVLQARGAYRAPTEEGFAYMVLTSLERLPEEGGAGG
jgi:hypothetical protein